MISKMITIRKAVSKDLNKIVNLDSKCFSDDKYSKNHWKKLIKLSHTYVATENQLKNKSEQSNEPNEPKDDTNSEKIIGSISVSQITIRDKIGGATESFMKKNNVRVCWLITTICVNQNYRKLGIGTMLINKIKNKLEHSDNLLNKPILLNVRESNIGAINFYKKHGFKKSKFKDIDYYDNPQENALLMYC